MTDEEREWCDTMIIRHCRFLNWYNENVFQGLSPCQNTKQWGASRFVSLPKHNSMRCSKVCLPDKTQNWVVLQGLTPWQSTKTGWAIVIRWIFAIPWKWSLTTTKKPCENRVKTVRNNRVRKPCEKIVWENRVRKSCEKIVCKTTLPLSTHRRWHWTDRYRKKSGTDSAGPVVDRIGLHCLWD